MEQKEAYLYDEAHTSVPILLPDIHSCRTRHNCCDGYQKDITGRVTP